MKRILVLADFHCGHLAGLTPPRWQLRPKQDKGSPSKRAKFLRVQEEAWTWYSKAVAKFRPYDHIVLNGDAIDGRGERSGSTELITVDREEQRDMAIVCVQRAMGANRVPFTLTFGTAYHTGDQEDFEREIANCFGGKSGSHEWLEAEGKVLDFRHHVGSSTVPHGRATPVLKEGLWNTLWALKEEAPQADVIVRSHVHHYQCIENDLGVFVTTPALQAGATKYGGRRCSGTISFGFVVIDVDRSAGPGEEICVRGVRTRLKSLYPKVEKVR